MVLSYHSLEDEIVKKTFRDKARVVFVRRKFRFAFAENPLKILTPSSFSEPGGRISQSKAASARLRALRSFKAVGPTQKF